MVQNKVACFLWHTVYDKHNQRTSISSLETLQKVQH